MSRNRSRKWIFVGQEAQRLMSLGMRPAEIARKLDVEQSTVSRWIASGKLVKGRAKQARRRTAGVPSPADWAADVRREYQLSITDEQLVELGVRALTLASDLTQPAPIRLLASARFQSLAKQLQLGLSERPAEDVPADQSRRPKRPVTPRTGGDPRRLLQFTPPKDDAS